MTCSYPVDKVSWNQRIGGRIVHTYDMDTLTAMIYDRFKSDNDTSKDDYHDFISTYADAIVDNLSDDDVMQDVLSAILSYEKYNMDAGSSRQMHIATLHSLVDILKSSQYDSPDARRMAFIDEILYIDKERNQYMKDSYTVDDILSMIPLAISSLLQAYQDYRNPKNPSFSYYRIATMVYTLLSRGISPSHEPLGYYALISDIQCPRMDDMIRIAHDVTEMEPLSDQWIYETSMISLFSQIHHDSQYAIKSKHIINGMEQDILDGYHPTYEEYYYAISLMVSCIDELGMSNGSGLVVMDAAYGSIHTGTACIMVYTMFLALENLSGRHTWDMIYDMLCSKTAYITKGNIASIMSDMTSFHDSIIHMDMGFITERIMIGGTTEQ